MAVLIVHSPFIEKKDGGWGKAFRFSCHQSHDSKMTQENMKHAPALNVKHIYFCPASILGIS